MICYCIDWFRLFYAFGCLFSVDCLVFCRCFDCLLVDLLGGLVFGAGFGCGLCI